MASNYEYHKSLDWEAEDLLSKHTFMGFITSSDARLLGIKGMLLALIMLGASDPRTPKTAYRVCEGG